MNLKTLNRHDLIAIENQRFKKLKSHSTCLSESRVCFSSRHGRRKYQGLSGIGILLGNRCNRLITACITPSQEIVGKESEVAAQNADNVASVSAIEELDEATEMVECKGEEFMGNDSLWNQIVEIVKFSGPAVGLWICGPLMSLIDTVVIGQGSAIELAALGPGTVLCDNMSYVFMFLSIATSNMIATSLAKQGKNQVQHQISILLCIGLTCGILMLFFARFVGAWALTAFTGAKNVLIIPAANTYVQLGSFVCYLCLCGSIGIPNRFIAQRF